MHSGSYGSSLGKLCPPKFLRKQSLLNSHIVAILLSEECYLFLFLWAPSRLLLLYHALPYSSVLTLTSVCDSAFRISIALNDKSCFRDGSVVDDKLDTKLKEISFWMFPLIFYDSVRLLSLEILLVVWQVRTPFYFDYFSPASPGEP